ncbi:MAG: lysophospholipase [Pseudomonadota bacterium]|nr:lysophospholipase [Pseudomonadota bacterium]
MGASTGKLASELFFRSWFSEDIANGVVLISHGLGEHSGRYDHVARAFTENHLHVYALDHIGHGQSPGRRAFVALFSDLTAGVAELRSHIASEHPDLPVVLIGHSMGGLIAARAVLDAPPDYQTLILTGPLLGVPAPPPAWQTWLLRTLSALFPSAKAMDINASAVSRDQAVVDDYVADPLVHHENIPARPVVSLFDEARAVLGRASEISLPTLLLHGEEDQLTSVSASRQFMADLSATDKHIMVYPDMYHELFNEPEREDIICTCLDWIAARL